MTDIKYSKAMKKIEELISKIESEEVDVDDLSARVKEAVDLIEVCKNKIAKAEMEVKKVVDNFESIAIDTKE